MTPDQAHQPRPLDRHGWSAVLAGVRADALDCLQTTLALLADRAHGTGTHLRLGCRWRMPVRRADATTAVQASPRQRLADARELLGLPAGRVWRLAGLDQLDAAGPAYLVADAYRLPWLPYRGHRHMDHSFLVEARGSDYLVVDPYHNDTPWGPARPGAWRLTAGELQAAVGDRAVVAVFEPVSGLPALDVAALLADNARRTRAAVPDIERYLVERGRRLADPEAMAALVLDVWLLARERRLHAAWLGPEHPAAAAAGDRADAWHRLTAHSFVAQRRLERSGIVHSGVLDEVARQLYADVRFADDCAGASQRGSSSVLAATVLGAVQATLGLHDREVDRRQPLRSLPGFDSFRLVEVIDRVEQALGVLLPSDVAAEDLQDIDGLCRAFARGAPAS